MPSFIGNAVLNGLSDGVRAAKLMVAPTTSASLLHECWTSLMWSSVWRNGEQLFAKL